MRLDLRRADFGVSRCFVMSATAPMLAIMQLAAIAHTFSISLMVISVQPFVALTEASSRRCCKA